MVRLDRFTWRISRSAPVLRISPMGRMAGTTKAELRLESSHRFCHPERSERSACSSSQHDWRSLDSTRNRKSRSCPLTAFQGQDDILCRVFDSEGTDQG